MALFDELSKLCLNLDHIGLYCAIHCGLRTVPGVLYVSICLQCGYTVLGVSYTCTTRIG